MGAVRAVATVAGVLVLTASLVLTAARLWSPGSIFWVLVTSFVPWAVVGYALALVLLALGLLTTQRVLAVVLIAVCTAGLLAHLIWLAPWYSGKQGNSRPDLTVLELNLLHGRADPMSLAALVRQEQPQVVVLEEASTTALAGFARAGVGGPGSTLPYLGGQVNEVARGTVVLSAYPLNDAQVLPIDTGAYEMTVDAPRPFDLLAVHTTQPLISVSGWREHHRILLEAVQAERRHASRPLLAVGDFNATLDHAPMRQMLRAGLVDAARETGVGLQFTWPANGKERLLGIPIPPLLPLDHVLVSKGAVALSITTHTVAGTDHRALVARIAVNS